MRKAGYYILFLIGLLLTACEAEDTDIYSPRENFETLWKIMDEYYCFFEYKQIDWQEVYDRYSPQVHESMDQYELFDLLGEMLSELQDGHTNLISSFNTSRYWAWYEDYPANFSSDILNNYLGKSNEYKQVGGIKYRVLDEGRIGYIYYGSFNSGIGDSNLDYILHYFKDCYGLIIDIRDNGGGTLSNSDRIASRFLEERTLVGYMQHKTGKGHTQFSDPYPVYLNPSERIHWTSPVVVLTNRRCYSAANNFVQKMSRMPQVTIMGDRTGGGSGFPFHSELPNGWSIRFSASPMLDENKEHTEFGIAPDMPVSMTTEDAKEGKDTLIETAILHLRPPGT
ncbi:S41 family peptidase [Parabacteroides sp. OttesenSCG-928-O15]|nr:S41 family peptidase [Parabacteroides sp. OttesenSCG-928-O15]